MPDRRLYAQFTLDYADSHKIAPLSDAAFRAHVRMILWSRRMLTDGRIPAAMALVLCDRKKKVLAELTSNDPQAPSLIQLEGGEYLLHDFLDHQSSRAQVEARQETNRANGARGGQAKAKRTATDSPPESRTESVSSRAPNFYTESESESETRDSSERTRPVLETAISADDDGSSAARSAYWAGWKVANPTRLIALIAQTVDRPIDERQAVTIVAGLLAKASRKQPVRSVEAYIEGALEKSWAEIQRDLDAAAVAA